MLKNLQQAHLRVLHKNPIQKLVKATGDFIGNEISISS